MAGDWVKIRVGLNRDPRVIAMAARLANTPAYVRWATGGRTDNPRDIGVTLGVTESVTVTALSHVWGVTRRDGVVTGDDITLPCATLATVDRITDVPGFGDAMAAVGWVVPTPDGGLLFPKLVPHVTSSDERKRDAARVRKQKQRDKERDVSRPCHTNVTPRREEKREEIKTEDPPTPRNGGTARKPRKADAGEGVEALAIPGPIDTPDVRAAWAEWLACRKAKGKPVTGRAAVAQLAGLATLTPAQAVACIMASIANDWQGLFPEKYRGNTGPPRRGFQTRTEELFDQLSNLDDDP